MNVKPVGSRIIVLPIETKREKTKGGLEIPELELEKGKVVLVSDAISDIYKIDAIVLFPKKTGNTIIINGKPHLWLKGGDPDNSRDAGDIWGIVTEE